MLNSRYDNIPKILARQLAGGLVTEAEQSLLDEWLLIPQNREVRGQLNNTNARGEMLQTMHEIDVRRVKEGIPSLNPERLAAPVIHRVHLLRRGWFRYAAAIMIVAGVGAYLWNAQQKKDPQITETKPAALKTDIQPGSNRAILTLSDGKKVELNNAASETINDGNNAIKNSNGQLVYSSVGGAERALPDERSEAGTARERSSTGRKRAYNTMSTPKGGQYQLTLSDGTKVWLNAASSITYPVAFTGNAREVSITGEAYFEVARNSRQPFHVKTSKDLVEVLGTSFNVNAYSDEPISKTSLVEGSVKINNKILAPGQAFANGKIIATNMEQDLAWKNGIFNFSNKKLPEAMRQLARWYDVDVKIEGNLNHIEFSGTIGRNLSLQQVLRGLEGIDDVHFQLNGKTLTVTP